MAKRRDQSEHDRMVETIANGRHEPGTRVKADLGGQWERPDQIVNHIPDVELSRFIFRGGALVESIIIYEVETHDSISDEHTAAQWAEFSIWAAARPYRQFRIAVPRGSRLEAAARAHNLGIRNASVEEC